MALAFDRRRLPLVAGLRGVLRRGVEGRGVQGRGVEARGVTDGRDMAPDLKRLSMI